MQDYAIFGSKRSFLVFGLCLLFLPICGINGAWAWTIEWTKYDNTIPQPSNGSSTNGKIPLGIGGIGDNTHVQTPSVIKDGSTYRVWYMGYSGATGYRIYYATSSNGLEWTKYDNTPPANSYGSSTNGKIPIGSGGRGDDTAVGYQSVIKDGSTYKMWYGGRDASTYRIFYATSSNGLEWAKYDNNNPPNSDSNSSNGRIPLGTSGKGDDYWCLGPSVIQDGPTYKMWYSGHDGTNWRVYYASSTNAGLNWTKYDNTVPANSDGSSTNGKIPLGTSGKGDALHVYCPSVVQDGSTYRMWYAGSDGTNFRIYRATSTNGGLTWTKLDNSTPSVSDSTNSNSRIGLGSGSAPIGDRTNVFFGCVVRSGDRDYKMWYTGYDGVNYRIYHGAGLGPPTPGTIFTFR